MLQGYPVTGTPKKRARPSLRALGSALFALFSLGLMKGCEAASHLPLEVARGGYLRIETGGSATARLRPPPARRLGAHRRLEQGLVLTADWRLHCEASVASAQEM